MGQSLGLLSTGYERSMLLAFLTFQQQLEIQIFRKIFRCLNVGYDFEVDEL